MDFLMCRPYVAVVSKNYQIVIITKEKGLISVVIDDKRFFADNDGVLSSEKNYAKIEIPQSVLDCSKKYTVAFAKTIERKSYFSQFEKEVYTEFAFKPIEKQEEINVYHIADIHFHFDIAKKTADYFGNDVDLFIVNGDVGEVEKIEDYFESCAFIGEITRSEIPVIIARGNHDVRGKSAEYYGEFFPTVNGKTYFDFKVGNLGGVVFDCGEDKPDNHKEYGSQITEKGFIGTNIFSDFRKTEGDFLSKLNTDKSKINLAIGHICPIQPTTDFGSVFDIEREEYSRWNEVFNSKDFKFMICGHIHFAYIVNADDSSVTTEKHNYPIIVGSALTFYDNMDETLSKTKFTEFTESIVGGTNTVEKNSLVGTALTVYKNSVLVRFTDQNKKVIFKTKIEY